MSTDLRATRARATRAHDVARRLSLPLRTGRFWLVQAGVLFVAFLDEVVLDVLGVQPPFEIPRSVARDGRCTCPGFFAGPGSACGISWGG